jgi:hypothetical protein
VAHPKLDQYLASRNLWNLYALDHFSEKALVRFSQAFVDSDHKRINQLDIANAIRSFAHFKYLNYDCVELLLKQSIEKVTDFNLQTLAVVVNSFSELNVANPTLLGITKAIILEKIDEKNINLVLQQQMEEGKEPMHPKKFSPNKSYVKPVDCAMLLSAFVKAEMFEEVELFESLEAAFLSRIEEASGVCLATIFNAHQTWAAHVMDECVQKKR